MPPKKAIRKAPLAVEESDESDIEICESKKKVYKKQEKKQPKRYSESETDSEEAKTSKKSSKIEKSEK